MSIQRFMVLVGLALAVAALSCGVAPGWAQNIPQPIPNPEVDYNAPNYAYSPILRKFVNSLPGLGEANKNNLGQYIPVAVPDAAAFPGSDYYEIGLKDFRRRMHSDLPATGVKIRGYYQKNGTIGSNSKQYLGPLIIAQRDRPVRIKFFNELGKGAVGNLFLPVDTTVMGAGMGPDGMNFYSQNRATIHLHGGFTPWVSDGTPHQWLTPPGDPTPYKKGLILLRQLNIQLNIFIKHFAS